MGEALGLGEASLRLELLEEPELQLEAERVLGDEPAERADATRSVTGPLDDLLDQLLVDDAGEGERLAHPAQVVRAADASKDRPAHVEPRARVGEMTVDLDHPLDAARLAEDQPKEGAPVAQARRLALALRLFVDTHPAGRIARLAETLGPDRPPVVEKESRRVATATRAVQMHGEAHDGSATLATAPTAEDERIVDHDDPAAPG